MLREPREVGALVRRHAGEEVVQRCTQRKHVPLRGRILPGQLLRAYGDGVPRKKVGRISDIDILPSVHELLGSPIPDRLPGHSVFGGSKKPER